MHAFKYILQVKTCNKVNIETDTTVFTLCVDLYTVDLAGFQPVDDININYAHTCQIDYFHSLDCSISSKQPNSYIYARLRSAA